MNTVWILGAGRFGQIAVERLHQKFPAARLTVVDRQTKRPPGLAAEDIAFIESDAVAYLVAHLRPEEGRGPDWIVPALPLHVAFEWIRRRLEDRFRFEKIMPPEAAANRLPNVLSGSTGTVYTSIADFICPDDCPEPAQLCTHTGRPRPCTLYRKLQNLALPGWTVVMVRSRQLLPGVGGYRPDDLFQALTEVKAAATPILLATACRCHAVVDTFQLHRSGQAAG